MASDWNDSRPMAPHLQVWKWHVTMLNSIGHRVTGGAMYVGTVLVVAWLMSIAMGPGPYEFVHGLLMSPLGLLVMIGYTLAITFHLANGLRYLAWDTGSGFSPKVANLTAGLAIAFAFLATAAIWVAAFLI